MTTNKIINHMKSQTITINKSYIERLKYYTDKVRVDLKLLDFEIGEEFLKLTASISALLAYLEALNDLKK